MDYKALYACYLFAFGEAKVGNGSVWKDNETLEERLAIVLGVNDATYEMMYSDDIVATKTMMLKTFKQFKKTLNIYLSETE